MTQLTRCPRCSRYAIKEDTEGWCVVHGSFDLRPLVPLPQVRADEGKRQPRSEGVKL